MENKKYLLRIVQQWVRKVWSIFNWNKEPIDINNTDIIIIVIRKRKPYCKKVSFKYVIVYDNSDNIRPLCIMLPQMIRYAKYFDSKKTYCWWKKTVKSV